MAQSEAVTQILGRILQDPQTDIQENVSIFSKIKRNPKQNKFSKPNLGCEIKNPFPVDFSILWDNISKCIDFVLGGSDFCGFEAACQSMEAICSNTIYTSKFSLFFSLN